MFNQTQTPAQSAQNQYPSKLSTSGSTGTTGGSSIEVPEAREALNNMKHEIASELGINLKNGYNGDLSSRQAGYIGGYMVKRLIEQAERSMSGH
jgi:hypothetical protein